MSLWVSMCVWVRVFLVKATVNYCTSELSPSYPYFCGPYRYSSFGTLESTETLVSGGPPCNPYSRFRSSFSHNFHNASTVFIAAISPTYSPRQDNNGAPNNTCHRNIHSRSSNLIDREPMGARNFSTEAAGGKFPPGRSFSPLESAVAIIEPGQ